MVSSTEKQQAESARSRGNVGQMHAGGGTLATLLRVSRLLSAEGGLRRALHAVLGTLEEEQGAVRAVLALVDPEEGDVQLEVSIGLAADHATRFRIGEGVLGKVVESGSPTVVSQRSRAPLPANGSIPAVTSGSTDYTFFCVPVLLSRAKIGALGVEVDVAPSFDHRAYVEFLQVVAAMIAQALKLQTGAEGAGRDPLETTAHRVGGAPGEKAVSLGDAVARFEEEMISDALRSTRGNRAKAARLLGSTERIINYKIDKYRIDCRRFRE